MAKSNRGGKRTSGAAGLSGAGGTPIATQSGVQHQAQIDDTQQAQPMSASYDSFMAMTDDQKADAIEQSISQGAPAHLSQSEFQKFSYNQNLNDKPQVVDDSVLDGMTGTELFRTVNFVKDTDHGLTYTATDIANQVMYGTKTRYSDNGGSAYGRGIYFADDYGESTGFYGNVRGNTTQTAVMRAKVNSNAKIINHSAVQRGLQSEISSGSKLGRTLSKISRRDRQSAESIYAISKGYNIIISGHGYFNILNRNAITMSSTVKPKGSGW